ncbi:GABA permease [Acinetobacter sp. ANC 3929]|uniref:amino acid permease n=1 Tax=unclassified Acinetobacter TaxID=196816 RepID=UPI0002CE2F1C|nr:MULTISPECIES: amino acid permease [unclassified Acinetobacter]ENW81721.1 GABA permease [Acinetobacter sp. ANC 3929]MCH7353199.1 amino acid permease [Acinetobacter sp. NIPH 2023]MCH7356880.1 amino acid permease [Acinetobacter sp. NIPH 1958]MCH7360559.1 amino acid permease [Acinetobacter sp. NIPH 2024]
MNSDKTTKLGEGLSNRHITMISIGGVIGAGLFVGSSAAIAKAGPAAVLAYIITSILVFLVMRMLGEMAVAQPDTGSFSTYARKAIGPWAGFSIGWLYWWFWVLVIPIEAIAGAEILHAWFPQVSSAIYAFAFIILLSLANFFSTKSFGEFEFWFALIKVIAIIVFILIGLTAVFGFWPLAKDVRGVGHLFSNGGFMPHGMGGVLSAILISAFSFFGIEILSIAAAESKNPEEKIKRATNLVLYRIILFFVVSIFLAVALVDWRSPDLQKLGTFQYVLVSLNVPQTKLIMDTVVFIAVASCMNAAVYTSSRMLFALGARHEAPKLVTKINGAGVPTIAVFASTFVGVICCAVNYLFPGQVFGFLLSTTGSIALLVYLVIAFSQLRLRSKLEKEGATVPFKMWLFPWLTWFVIIVIMSVLGYMFLSPQYSHETTLSLSVTIGVVICGLIVTRKQKSNRPVAVPVD